ncbi:DUF599 domain-containing protein [Methylovirgula sp. 4M-Z18]|uniref:DUF599 domain-containing protein n=1 Tax=Methylovirgula sp. 4M-Z18 TaxID=2293567 RepID=UPI000E2EF4CB|nr:DUF599 family protein [Methylovirgula sp. 4M-Z18]RFB80815.1 DUF599 family protein [Methylovirgula sp. 4M-Z18]
MLGITIPDLLGLLVFLAAWLGYHFFVERSYTGRHGLNSLMNQQRVIWMQRMADRDARIVDASIMAALQSGTAFFASTSLFAIGAATALLRYADDALKIFEDLPFAATPSRSLWEIKSIGLMIIFIYAFFKFSWSYRLFNYSAILIGATPMPGKETEALRRVAALRAAEMNVVASRHFNRGQRAFFFALAYLGWFVTPYLLIVATVGVLYVMWARQYTSEALRAVTLELDTFDGDNS